MQTGRTAASRTTDGERGFTLIELVVCIALFALVSAATVGGVAVVLRNASPNGTRDVALMVLENTLARARVAAAYVPIGTAMNTAPFDPAAANLLSVQPQAFTAGAQLRANGLCNSGGASLQLLLPVRTTYANSVLTVTVTYPRDPCRVAADGTIPSDDALTITQSETLSPPLYIPGHVLVRPVAVPARM